MDTAEAHTPHPAALCAEACGRAPARGRLTGRRILLGAGQQNYGLADPPLGNGRAMSRLFAREGAALALVDIDRDAVGETAHQLERDGATAHVVLADASQPHELQAAVATAQERMHGLCTWLAKHCAPRNIRINLVIPGLLDTSLGRLASQATPNRREQPIPLGREGTAWEVAHAAAFLLSGEPSYITGHSLLVDGGLLALR